MAYEKHNWVCGETVTAELLNNIEGGVQEALGGSTSAPLIVTANIETMQCEGGEAGTKKIYTYDHSWQEIYDALSAGRPTFMAFNISNGAGVAVFLKLIGEASHVTSPDEYVVQVDGDTSWLSDGRLPFSDANSLVYESECVAQ